ncbi:hypothetical protein Vse01_37850 [Micromonospora sediminimaris]|uniref:Uncharacterized protein n=1 Tax=Micromonospora sediminimaris TaxID=547162 RepID=A0A9W5XL42_9ACTN|nr:hypothetical protein Vse01_37850 [Micromonospora sediminimaris]
MLPAGRGDRVDHHPLLDGAEGVRLGGGAEGDQTDRAGRQHLVGESAQRVEGDGTVPVERRDHGYVEPGRCHAASLRQRKMKHQFRLLTEYVS